MQTMTPTRRGQAARILQALAHPVRLGVLAELADGERTLQELQKALACSQSQMSQQLKILEQQGLICSRRTGTVKHCRLANRDFLRLFTCLNHHIEQVLPRTAEAEGTPAAGTMQRRGTAR